jgi:predicted nucleic acid-binding protein
MDAFDADVLIHAATTGSLIGARIRRLYAGSDIRVVGIGSRLLECETLIKPVWLGALDELAELRRLLARLELHDVTQPVSNLAVDLGAKYRLRTPDAVHLATAVMAGADRFITNNRRDFTKDVAEVDVTYPDELPAA